MAKRKNNLGYLMSLYNKTQRLKSANKKKPRKDYESIAAWLGAFPDGFKVIKADLGLLYSWKRPKGMRAFIGTMDASRMELRFERFWQSLCSEEREELAEEIDKEEVQKRYGK